jgi:hypothetical protein
MNARQRSGVRQRAGERCEYCHIPDQRSELPFHVEHIVANVHQRNDSLDNLAWACPRCNAHKGTNLTALDPSTGQRADVFSPRTDDWDEHFQLDEYVIVGLSAVGRATASLLRMNAPLEIENRREMMQ